jgi:hypothetical protein
LESKLFKEIAMAKKLSKSTVSELMATWGRKGGSRATQAQKNAARENLKKTPNYQKHKSQIVDTMEKCTQGVGTY